MATTTDGVTAGEALTAETLAAMEAATTALIATADAGPYAASTGHATTAVTDASGDVRIAEVFDIEGSAPLLAASWALAQQNLALLAEVRRLTAALDGIRDTVELPATATTTEVVAAVEERAGMLAHAVQSWKARASGMEAAEREVARLRAIVDAVRSAREDVRSTAARYDAAWTGVESVPNAAQAEEIAARLTESYMAGDALSAALDALLSPAADVARDAPGVG